MNYKAAIFDLDGTLLDTLDDLMDAVNWTLALYGYPARTKEQIRMAVGSGVDRLIELSVPGGRDDPHFDDVVREYRAYYPMHAEIKTKPYEGVNGVIDRLIAEGVRTAVVSNKPNVSTVKLCHKYFPTIGVTIGERESEGIRRKPYPDTVIAAAEELGCALSDCVYIGDSEVDIATAKNAGIDCISVLWGFRDRNALEEAGGNCFVRDPDELEKALLG